MPEGSKQTRLPDESQTRRKKYVKPECISEPIYETMALACGKLPGQNQQCNAAPFRS